MKKFILNLQFIYKPNYWFMSNPYSHALDLLINDLLDNFDFDQIEFYTAKLGGVKLWIANQPYNCIIPCNDCGKNLEYRPSRLTILKAIKRLEKVQLDQIRKNSQLIY